MSSEQVMLICRGCLSSEHKLINATLYESEYKDLTGIIISPSDGLPQWLCKECVELLQKCVQFRNKIMKSHYILCQCVLEGAPLDVKGSVDKTSLPYIIHEHSLVKKEPDFCNYEDNVAEECREHKPQADVVSPIYDDTKTIVPVMSHFQERAEEVQVKEENAVVGDDAPVVIKIEQIEVKDESSLCAYEDNITIEESCINQQITLRNESAINKSEHGTKLLKMKRHKMHAKGNTVPESVPARAQLDKNTNTSSMLHEENDAKTFEISIDSNNYLQSNVNSYICNECSKCYDNKILFIAHIREHLHKTRYKCNLCLKYFIDKDTLNRHHALHKKGKSYKCDICMKYFKSKKYLSVHRRIHTGSKLHKCDVCMKTFNKKYNLTRHIRIHNGDKPYSCDVCSKRFCDKNYLNVHYRTHTGEQPYKCDVCKKQFNSKYNFTKHYQIHTGDKTYKCDVCMKCFNEKSNLDVHYRIHTGDKPYQCKVCMKRFTQKGHLDGHYRMHTGELLYYCDKCSIGFKHKSSIIKHVSKRKCGKKTFI